MTFGKAVRHDYRISWVILLIVLYDFSVKSV